MDTAGMGLRERKKCETRQALMWATLRLAVERGLSNVLVEDIAAEAGVSPRTFNNYFASKAEAICARHLDRARATAEALRARPTDEPLWDAIRNAILAPLPDTDRPPEREWILGVRLMITEPALQGEFLKVTAIAEDELAAVIADRTGLSASRDLYPHLVAAAVAAAGRTAYRHWLRTDPPVPMVPLLRDALTQIAAGLPTPESPKGNL